MEQGAMATMLAAGPIDGLTDEELGRRVDWAFQEAHEAVFFSAVAVSVAAVLSVSRRKAREAALILLDGLADAGCPAGRVETLRALGRD